MKGSLLAFIVMSLAVFAAAQSKTRPLPCEFSGKLLLSDTSQPIWLTSGQMTNRATHKEDIDLLLKRADVKGTAIVDVLVDASGGVACVKSVTGHPMIRTGV